MNASVQAGPVANPMSSVNPAQAPVDAVPGTGPEAWPDGGFRDVLEQRMQAAGTTAGDATAGEAPAQAPPADAAAVPQLVDSNRIAAHAMAAFLATQPSAAGVPGAQAALPSAEPLLQAIVRGPLSAPALPGAGRPVPDAEGPGVQAAAESPPDADLRAAMDAAAGKRLPQASVDSPAAFRALMADVAARGGVEGGAPLPAGGPAVPEGGATVHAHASAPAAPSPGEARAATTQVATPFGRPEWPSAMNERVTWLVGQRVQSADIQLNPPQLGPVEVRITIQNDQANLYFTSQHAAVREAIQAALPRLNEMLAQGGLSLGQTSVGAESFAGQQQASRDGHGRHPAPDLATVLDAPGAGAAGQGTVAVIRGRVGIDMFV